MKIRQETDSDSQAITDITVAAFKTLEISNKTEQFIINALRSDGALTISLVAETEEKIIGHVAFSPVTISDDSKGWYALGPVSVLPEYQKQGIGKSLINNGLSMLRDMDGSGCVLVGDPDYYKRFGFKNFPQLIHEGVPQKVFLALPFNEVIPNGRVVFHKGFWAKE